MRQIEIRILALDPAAVVGEVRELALVRGWQWGGARDNPIGATAGTVAPETADQIRALRAQGLSIGAIVATLNEQGVTGPRGGRWWPRTVHLALRRLGLS